MIPRTRAVWWRTAGLGIPATGAKREFTAVSGMGCTAAFSSPTANRRALAVNLLPASSSGAVACPSRTRREIDLHGPEIVYAGRARRKAFAALMFERAIPLSRKPTEATGILFACLPLNFA